MTKKFDVSKDKFLQLYLEAGTGRSIPKLLRTCSALYPDLPCLKTLREWSNRGDWMKKAEEYDLEVMRQVESQTATESVKRIFNAREKLENQAESMLKRVEDFFADESLSKISDYDQLEKAMKWAIEAVKLTEVLRGNVSDRQSLELEVSEKERQAELREKFHSRIDAVKDKVEQFQQLKAVGGKA